MRLPLLALCLWAAAPAGAQDCPENFLRERTGSCWTRNPSGGRAYVHAHGWMISEECFSDSRFTRAELLAALDVAWDKINPRRMPRRGCLGRFNPDWGGNLRDFLWRERTMISCRINDPAATQCADTGPGRWAYTDERTGETRPISYHAITMGNVRRCMADGGAGLAGVLFHETLHAQGAADRASAAEGISRADHNAAWSLPQARFVRDAVYGAQAVCFFGVDPSQRWVNLLQCLGTVRVEAEEDREHLCSAFNASFSGISPPAGFYTH